MTEFTLISACDSHISDTNPRSRKDNYKEAILNKISQWRIACKKLNADAAIHAGDLFNIKYPSKNSHALNQELIKEFKQFSCPIYMIEGNHDLTANNLDSLKEQPLGVLFADNTLNQLRHQIIEKDGVKISLVGIPYMENLDLSTLKIPEKGDCITQVCVMHLYASLKGGKLFKEKLYGYDELSKLSPDIFILGHYHVDQGIYEYKGKHFVNTGSMSRGVLSEEDINHNPQIGLIKINVEDGKVSYNLKAIRLKVAPPEEIFDLVKREEEQKEQKEIEAFVDKLVTETIVNSGDNTLAIDNILSSIDITQIIKDKVMFFIKEAELLKRGKL